MSEKPSPGDQVRKYFVLDTNVLLHNPSALFMFKDNEGVIPFTFLEELDKFKKQNDDVGRNARDVIRHLDSLRLKAHLRDGVAWNGRGGRIRVDFTADERPRWLKDDAPDNRIIGVAWALQQQGKKTIFISKDINVRLKSDALGIHTEDFEAQKVNADHLQPGYICVDVAAKVIDTLYKDKHLEIARLKPYQAVDSNTLNSSADHNHSEELLYPNQFVQLRDLADPAHTGLARRLGDTDHAIPAHGPRKPISGIMARNVQQTMALDLLLDDQVILTTLLGTAGTGKTLLAIAAGMHKTFVEHRYDKLLVARPIMPMGHDIGYLPGDKDEKISAWMQPIFDNLTYLLSTRGAGSQHAESKSAESRIQHMVNAGKLVLEPLTYIRGRSIPNQFIIVDESQNLTPHEVKTIVSRVGVGTKIVLTGAIAQIDNLYLDSSSNGLSYLVEQMKNESIVGTVALTKSECSNLASLATEKL